MRPAGIVRRLDDLGRVVVPKEVQRVIGVTSGDPLEIFIHEDMVCFKLYQPEFDFDEDMDNEE